MNKVVKTYPCWLIAFFVLPFAVVILLFLPEAQNYLISFGEYLVGRPLNRLVWQERFIEWRVDFIFFYIVCSVLFFLMRFFPQAMPKLADIIVISFVVAAVAPIIYYGKGAIFTVHDDLDSHVAWLKMLKDLGLLLAIDSPTNSLGNMSTAYFGFISYNIMLLPYIFFDVFTAHVVLFILKILVGYFSMFILLTYLFPDDEKKTIIKFVSLSFALLPAHPIFSVAFNSAPLCCYFFLKIKKDSYNRLDKRVFLLFFFPLVSYFTVVGFFLLCLWAIGIVILWLREKNLNLNLFAGLCSLAVGYIVVDAKLFYAMFILREQLNRKLTNQYLTSLKASLKLIPENFFFGQYHAPIIASQIIFPIVFLTLLLAVVYIFCEKRRGFHTSAYINVAAYVQISLVLLFIASIFSFAASLVTSSSVVAFVSSIFPFLKGFNWGRFVFLNRIIVYIVFAIALMLLSRFKRMRFFLYSLAIFQAFIVLNYSGMYGYSAHNLFHAKYTKIHNMLTYNEFFSESFFAHIKSDLQYQGEGVAALGFHPGVLMYNGFSTVDGYNNAYPLWYALAFREIIAPQLDLNAEHKKYYDSWAGRMYLYNDEIDTKQPMRIPFGKPVTLHINAGAFRKLGGRYILSRAEIENAESLQLYFVKKYSGDSSVYEIFVYEMPSH